MPGSHAVLSPSGSHRWMNCTPSVRLTEGMVEEESPYAEEGTEAHLLCAYHVDRELGRDTEDPRSGMRFYTEEMEECAQDYRNFVMDVVNGGPVQFVDTEVELDMSRWIPEGHGTSDCLVLVDKELHVIDFKYGKGVRVDAENNSQLMIYAVGALDLLDGIFDIDDVVMTIFQPRLRNIGSSRMKKTDLLRWADETLRPVAEQAWSGCGELMSGDWCRWCLIKASCRKRAEENLAAARLDFRRPPLLTDEELGEVLSKADELDAWVGDIKAYALSRLLAGGDVPGWKAVEGRSNRRWADAAEVAEIVQKAGFDPFKHDVLGIGDMTEMLGKERFNELLADLVVKPRGRATLARIDDRRQAITSAVSDFKE